MIQEKWLIKGGWTAHGEVDISGDSYSAISNICHAISHHKNKIIDNVPRSQEVLAFIEFLNQCGFKIEWKSAKRINCHVDWKEFNPDLTKIDFNNPRFYELAVDLIINNFGSCKVSLKFRKYLDRFKRLKLHITLIEDYGYDISIPLETDRPKMHIKSLERDFYTVLSYALLMKSSEGIYITPSGALDPISIFLSDDFEKRSTYVVDMNLREFNFYCGLAVLTEGEIILHNVSVSHALGFLLNISFLGATYEVNGDSLRVWYDYKKIEQYYNFTKCSPDELGYLLLYLSKYSSNKVLVKAKNSLKNVNVVKNINIMGAELSFNDLGLESIMIEVKPSSFKSFRQQIVSVDYGGVILAGSFVYNGNSIISDVDVLSSYFPFLSDSLINLDLKFSERENAQKSVRV